MAISTLTAAQFAKVSGFSYTSKAAQAIVDVIKLTFSIQQDGVTALGPGTDLTINVAIQPA